MVRNIVILGGNSHSQMTEIICNTLGVPSCDRILTKFSVGESRLEISDSVRGKDVYIVQSGGGKVNDHFIELCIMISACKTGSAKRVTAVLPLFPYSRQPDIPYNKVGAPLTKGPSDANKLAYTFESRPQTPHPSLPPTPGIESESGSDMHRRLSRMHLEQQNGTLPNIKHMSNGITPKRSSADSPVSENGGGRDRAESSSSQPPQPQYTSHDQPALPNGIFQPKPGYKQWVAQAGTLVADLLTCAGADHIITMDLHDPQYQGFFDIPVDNLYVKPLLKKYIQTNIPNYKDAVIVSPDAGGAKRATAIADGLNVDFALIHKVG